MIGEVSAFSVGQWGVNELTQSRKRLLRKCAQEFSRAKVGNVVDVCCPTKYLADTIMENYSRRKQIVRSERNPDGTYEVAIIKGGNY